MKIAQIAPMGETVPPKKYGGTERVVHALTEGLVNRGHEVTLFASGDSKTSANLISVYPKSLRESQYKNPYGAEQIAMLNVGTAYKMQDKFDIIQDHAGYISLPTSILATTPVVMTLHGAPSPDGKRLYESIAADSNNPYFVSVSYAQRKPMPSLNYIANIYNGLEMENYPFANENDGYLLFVGRIHPDKGLHHAIEVAEFLNLPLIIAAKLDTSQIPYYKRYIEPKLSDKITWVGEVTTQKRNKLMRALCLLHPIEWREPFGLTLIEAMACGCPPVAFRRGSIPEIIKHTKTGFIAEDTTEMIEYVRSIGKIKRKNCRTYALQKFNAERMIFEYEQLYEKILRISKTEIFKSPVIKSPIKN
ncbi:MAG: hypothetical protein A3C27_01030 [Candidatus Levybacteria bacterium RIFCSPHIGHO2_02_FULL_39_36]|nr:MAG: Glycosyl transferase group 1 [Candidatus Levybacteria bacterium GW2011_GWA1_39_11]KKR25098.1 MAG: Glycosyl transferase group 1 [Candidatus Levybacteria bacterium GW2011_GWB1_39_7]OGH15530.1 MAG: hypothetical protein A2689_03050 [Candidatus Levybacteria bacterium RIFCSPHIGHO2_01_FULL_38_96]OGH25440.1 MAG: hypothetical protein A3E68_01025 [Candidatus Levybacteria bacterium RIFCSPHIGHO2_12_FULL_39_39]OGH28397.1 MAG: hypothetical protein A3C27_01030 [Candidatus Levybacteria bacterium RIFCSP